MRHCPLCSSSDVCDVLELNYALFDELALPGRMQLSECRQCHFIYNNTPLTETDLARYYSVNEYYSESRSAGSGGYAEKDAARYARIYKQIASHVPAPAPVVLDFGCGKGGMLYWMRDNTEAMGIGVEASSSCRSYLADSLNVPVYGSLAEAAGPVDVVILSHVLEHILHPAALLEKLLKISHPDTIYYVEVPRAEFYLAGSIRWRELYFEHINHFSEATGNNLLTARGLRVIDKGKVFFYHDDENSPECLYFLAKPGRGESVEGLFTLCATKQGSTKPAEQTIPGVLDEYDAVSVWGMSQYSQLVLGSYPRLRGRLKCLFDSSSAKIGRKIEGVAIQHPENICLLGKDDILLIPESPYAGEMVRYIRKHDFNGQHVLF